MWHFNYISRYFPWHEVPAGAHCGTQRAHMGLFRSTSRETRQPSGIIAADFPKSLREPLQSASSGESLGILGQTALLAVSCAGGMQDCLGAAAGGAGVWDPAIQQEAYKGAQRWDQTILPESARAQDRDLAADQTTVRSGWTMGRTNRRGHPHRTATRSTFPGIDREPSSPASDLCRPLEAVLERDAGEGRDKDGVKAELD